MPDWQVQEYNEDLYILRESGCTDYEKPFLYLFFGKDRALLEDTGSGRPETARAVTGVISRWLRHNRRESIPLVVTHSHSHGDHIAGDSQFRHAGRDYGPVDRGGYAEVFGIRKCRTILGRSISANELLM